MSSDTPRRKPNVMEYIGYSYGRRLPDSMRDWVRNDLTGKGAIGRWMIRAAIPAALFLAPFWLIPASLYVHAEMTLPIFIWVVIFSHAFNNAWRRQMLAKHGLDPELVDVQKRKREAHIHRAYIERYGPRPDAAQPQGHDI
ncbi:DUF5313 domain-containing protein [Rhodococcus tukisamuensis]|uniref:DUF5313 domain-containing protein n=1 Tax=Rhodococcus tukisamuensis TaxID=168276 RepID=A0A1G6URS9_9NOCA|nr:DUF5313 domain-containing protein [Rhodococcus tukisamuensis]SDD44098.1 hypothetical protein SAMN05444580_104280 [Rhodococcus tukisamuensis]